MAGSALLSIVLLQLSLCFVQMSSFSIFSKRVAPRVVARLFSTELASSRLSSSGLSLDSSLISANSQLVISHLHSRKSAQELVDAVRKIPELRAQRNALIVEGDAARNARKTLSKEIAMLMKKGEASEAEKLKLKVEESNILSAVAAEKQQLIDEEIDRILSVVPNLLDDR